MKDIKDTITDVVGDAVSDLLYYDRKEDEDLPMGRIEEAVRDGEITKEEIIKIFADGINKHIKWD